MARKRLTKDDITVTAANEPSPEALRPFIKALIEIDLKRKIRKLPE
jgi:hypothetical protein